MEKDKKVTALYCRLSKDDGSAHESLSIRTQKAMLMEYATRNGFGLLGARLRSADFFSDFSLFKGKPPVHVLQVRKGMDSNRLSPLVLPPLIGRKVPLRKRM